MKIYIFINYKNRQFVIYNKRDRVVATKYVFHDDLPDDVAEYIFQMCSERIPLGYDPADPEVIIYEIVL